MRLVETVDPMGTPVVTEVYHGPSLDAMREALVEYLGDPTSRRAKTVTRWFDMHGRKHAMNGKEPLLGFNNAGTVNEWKIWQEPVGS